MRRFPRKLFVAALAVGFGYAAARVLAPLANESPPEGINPPPAINLSALPLAGGGTPTASPAAVEGPLADGNALMLRVLEALERRPNVVAKVRQSLRLGDQILAGDGQFWQQGVQNQRRTCWQWQTLTAGEPVRYRQVLTDGNYLWTDRRHGDDRTVTRVNVGQLIRQLEVDHPNDSFEQSKEFRAQPHLLARGGASQLAADLLYAYEFGAPRPIQTKDGPRLSLVGRWRQAELSRAWPERRDDGSWPDQLPHHVLVQIGASDLFPYLVEYRSGAQQGLAAADAGLQPTASPLARYEFYDVEYAAPMPKGAFAFQSAEVEWRDVTAETVERVRQRVAAAGQMAAAPASPAR